METTENQGYVYRVTCTKTGEVYIGHTTTTVEQRWSEHCSQAKDRERKLALGETYIGCNKFYAAITEHGEESFYVETLAEVSINEVKALEKLMITAHDSIINGYNAIGGTDNPIRPEAKAERQARAVARREGNANHNASLYDLPAHCHYLRKRDTEGLRIKGHPLCDNKEFMLCTYGTMEAAKEALLAYLAELNANGIKQPGLVKREAELPKGVRKVKNCYFVDKTLDSKTFRKAFSGGSDDENRSAALAYLNQILTTPGMNPEPTKQDDDLPRGITRKNGKFLVAKTIKGVAYREHFLTEQAARDYLNMIKTTPTHPTDKFVKKDADLPRGITKMSHKYVVCKNINKVKYKQSFDDLQDAINYLEQIIREHGGG